VFLICTSTYGQGDVPDNARALYEDLKAEAPDLSRVRYGVFGLGDRTYAETSISAASASTSCSPSLGAGASASATCTTPRAACCRRDRARVVPEWLAKVKDSVAAG
jgi:MioC protein